MTNVIHLIRPLKKIKRGVSYVRQWQLLLSQKQSQTFIHLDNRKFIIRDITRPVRHQNILTEKQIRATT